MYYFIFFILGPQDFRALFYFLYTSCSFIFKCDSPYPRMCNLSAVMDLPKMKAIYQSAAIWLKHQFWVFKSDT